MPKASAPNAPWVAVWLSPQTTVMPGQGQPLLGSDDVDDALAGVAHRVEADAELVGVAPQHLHLLARHGSATGWSMSVVGTLWSSVATVRSGRRTAPPGQAQPVERLRRGDLVDEVEVDVEQVGLAGRGVHDVVVPHLLGEGGRFGHVAASFCGSHMLGLRSRTCGTQCRRRRRARQGDARAGCRSSRVPARSPSCRRPPGCPRATAHRLAGALETHGWCARNGDGRYRLGSRLMSSARRGRAFPLVGRRAAHARAAAADTTDEGVQLFVREGDRRVCVISLESRHGLRWIVPVGGGAAPRSGVGRACPAGRIRAVRLPRHGRGGVDRPNLRRIAGLRGWRAWRSGRWGWRRSAPRCTTVRGPSSPPCPSRARSSGSPAPRGAGTATPWSLRPGRSRSPPVLIPDAASDPGRPGHTSPA